MNEIRIRVSEEYTSYVLNLYSTTVIHYPSWVGAIDPIGAILDCKNPACGFLGRHGASAIVEVEGIPSYIPNPVRIQIVESNLWTGDQGRVIAAGSINHLAGQNSVAMPVRPGFNIPGVNISYSKYPHATLTINGIPQMYFNYLYMSDQVPYIQPGCDTPSICPWSPDGWGAGWL